jgi:hypothetical protein
MALSDADFIKLNLPEAASFTKNGVTYAIDDLVLDVLAMPDVGENKYKALAVLFEMLEGGSLLLQSETLGDYSYQRPASGVMESAKWRMRAAMASTQSMAPNVILRGGLCLRRW